MSIPLKSAAPLTPPTANSGANNYSNMSGLAALKKDPTSPQAARAVAQQIDALFLQMMLKSMRDAGAQIGESDSNEMSMYQDMFDKQIALTLSQHQDLGLGAQLTRQLLKSATGTDPLAPASIGTISAAPGQATAIEVEGDQANAADSEAAAQSAGDFVTQVYPAIQRAAQALGVSPTAMLAQAALETGWGKRMPRGADGKSSLNLFGIKADDSWSGARVAADTMEFSGGVATPRRTAFRAYGSIEESVNDFARLLGSSPRYHEAVAGGADARAYVAAIGKSGYATDPDYANKLSGIMNSSTFRGALLPAQRAALIGKL